mmetsp:Transcript_1653/g.2365  ORF Transcript_1653/g.2365 Transcript_1653/m.2365 type:complete len:132 (+) Transcript_1653:450-845(+)
MKAMDMVPVYLRKRIGTKKVALSYIIQDDETPTLLEPLLGDPITSVGFESFMDKSILTTPHDGPEFSQDNAKVYQILQDMVAGSLHKYSIKAHYRARDGRSVYFSLIQHNMGSSKWDRVIDAAEIYLLRTE